MPLSADRASGLFFFVAGTAFYLFVIPANVEPITGGSIHPDTFPNALSLLIALCGLALVFKPTGHRVQGAREMALAVVYFGVICLSLFAMVFMGYAVVSPALALILMLLIGERRAVWLVAGSAVMPAIIWVLVEVVLERGLP